MSALKRVVKSLQNVLMRLQGLLPGLYAPTCPLLPLDNILINVKFFVSRCISSDK